MKILITLLIILVIPIGTISEIIYKNGSQVAGVYLSIISLGIFIYLIIAKDLLPPKPPKNKVDDTTRICGFRYSTKEDIDKRRKEIINYKF